MTPNLHNLTYTTHRSYSIELKRQVAKEYLAGARPNGFAWRYGVSRNLMATACRRPVLFERRHRFADGSAG